MSHGTPKKDAKAELDRLADAADAQGRQMIAKVCRLAKATIITLEADLATIRAGHAKHGLARAERLSPARRSEIASTAAKRRWLRRRAS